MAYPTNKAQFKEHCLRRLGKPVIEINVDEDQVDDRVDEAIDYYWDFHYDGIEQCFYKWQITEQNKTDRYLTVPENIVGVVDLFDIGDATSTNNLFNIRYQIALNDLYDLSRYELVPYYMNFQNIRMIEEILVRKQTFKYNKHANQLHIEMDWNRINAGDYIIAKAYKIMNPETYADVYKDRWLLRYASALIKKQRNERTWSQDHLASVSGLSLRTIQRIEKGGKCSLDSKKALASVFEINANDLDFVDYSL